MYACEFCSTRVSTCDVHITRYKEVWSTQTRNGVALYFSHGTTHVHACKNEVIIERYRSYFWFIIYFEALKYKIMYAYSTHKCIPAHCFCARAVKHEVLRVIPP